MAKKKEDLGGVWRTVGGRRIFIKDGQDLYEAMNDSGKFTNLKKINSQRKGKKISDELKKDVKDFMKETGWNKYLNANINKYDDFNEYKKAVEKDMKSLIEESEANYDDLQYVMSYLEDKGNAYKIDANLTNKIKTMTVIGADNKIVDLNMKEIERIEDAGSFYDIKFKNGWGMKSKDLVVAINGVETKEYLAERKAQKIDNFIKNNPKWENGNYDEDEFDDLADTLGVGRDKVSDEIYDRIREKTPEKINKQAKQDQLLAKASKIEEIEAEMKKVQQRIWDEESDMEAYGETNTSPAYDEDVWRLEDLRKELKQAKDDYWAEKNKVNEKRFEKELNSKPNYDKRPKSDVDRENDKNNRIAQAIEKGQKDFDPVAFEKWRQEHDPEFTMSDDGARYLYESYKKETKNFERGSKEHYDAMVKSGMSKKDAQHIVDLEKGNKRLNHDSYGSYHTKPKVDSHDLETLKRIADNYENENDYDMDDISKDYIKNRRNEMSFNKRNDEFIDTSNKTRNKTFRASDEVKIRDKDGNEYSINKENRFQTRDGYFDANELDNGRYLIFNNEHGVYYEVDNISEKTLEKYRNYHKEDEIKYNSLSELAKKYPEVFKKTTERNIYTDKNGAKIGHSMVVQYATMNHLTIEEAKKILGVK